MLMSEAKILHICVNYRNDHETKSFVESCLKLTGADQVFFVVCDNSAERFDSVGEILKPLAQKKNILLLANDDNPGYLGAAHRALEKIRSTLGLAPQDFSHVILSNTDLVIDSKAFYAELLKLAADSEVGLQAPSVISTLTGREGNPLYPVRPSLRKIRRLRFVYGYYALAVCYHLLSFLKARFLRCQNPSEGRGSVASDPYAVHGSFLILRSIFFRRGGTLNYPVRLYGEELFLAEQVRKLKLKTEILFFLKVVHREKGTESHWWGRIGLSRRTFIFKKESINYIASLWEAIA
mgnify:CR=1 FL=1